MTISIEWTIEYLDAENIVYVKTKGIMTKESANEYVKDVFEETVSHQCQRQLIDHRETSFAFSVVEYYERPDLNRQYGMQSSWKVAMVFRELNRDTLFMETVFRNRGYNFRQFDNIEEAKEWLLSPS